MTLGNRVRAAATRTAARVVRTAAACATVCAAPLAVAALASTLTSVPAGAQLYFGQNLVQYDRLNWRVLETEHFLLHYYPVEKEAAYDAARMAERSYARLSRLMQHQFREKKPIILFASRGDFAQSNVFGDLGEGTGGVTDPLRQRMAQPFTGDYRSFEHVLMHEMVHAFQFDIFSRGRAGANLQTLAQVNPPLWYMEGMAEFFSLGYDHPQTDAWVRDAAINGNLPSIKEMTERPDQFFPYRYGFSLWQYVGQRWGDQAIGEIMNAVPNLGIERAFKRELGLSLDELSDEWKEAMQLKHLPRIAELDRARKFAQPMLTQRRTGGIADLYIAPALSPDGKQIAFISYGNFLRGEVFPDLYLADAQTGKRIKRLVKSTTNSDVEELRQLYSQSSFSPDGRYLAYTAQRRGKDVLYILDVRKRETIRLIDIPGIEQVLSPSWSPDGRQLVITGNVGGITDLYLINADGTGLRQLTKDRYGDMQPTWSPDGKTIAFASDRDTDFEVLRLGRWKVSLYDLAANTVTEIPGQAGLNINPQWAPDGRSLIFVSDRTGTANLFLYDLDAKEHYQLTNVVGAVNSQTEFSPAISWAHQADLLAFVYYEKGTNNVWSIRNPRLLKKQPFRERAATPTIAGGVPGAPGAPGAVPGAAPAGTPTTVAQAPVPAADTTPESRSLYRTPAATFRLSDALPAGAGTGAAPLSVSAMLDSAALSLPDTARFKDTRYKAGFQPEYISQPQVGVGTNANYGQQLYGGTTIVLGDLLGNQQLAISAAVNGQISDAQVFVGYTNLARRLQYTTGISQFPVYYYSGQGTAQDIGGGLGAVEDNFVRQTWRDAFWRALYPFDRFTRIEAGARLTNITSSTLPITTVFDRGGNIVDIVRGNSRRIASASMVAPSFAFVRDNALFGYTAPIMGSRLRFQVEPQLGTWRWVDYLLDYRRYDPILFNFLTVSTRAFASITAGRDEYQWNKYLGRPDFIRGYNRENYAEGCGAPAPGTDPSVIESACGAARLFGSRLAMFNAELRFPLVRRFDLGVLPIALPPVDALVFYDAGVAWTGNAPPGGQSQTVSLKRPAEYNLFTQRYPLRSYGYGIRFNLFGFAILRWDYAWPLDSPNRKPFGTWFFGPSF